MAGNARTFILEDGTHANVPEESIDKWMQRMDQRGVKFRTADMSADMTVGEPEVIRTEKEAPLGRTLNLEEVRATTPEAPPGSDWLRGLTGASEDPTGFTALASDTKPEELGDIPSQLNSAAAGAVHGTVMGLERKMPGVREWSIEAEAAHPTAFAGGDLLSNVNPYAPGNLVGKVTRFIPERWLLGRVAGDVLTQGATGVVDSATRRWGDDPELDYTDALDESLTKEGLASAGAALPGALLGGLGARSHYRQTRPEAQALRQIEYQDARMRSAGLDPTAVKRLPPERQAEILGEIEMLTAQSGDGLFDAPSIRQLNLRAHEAARSAGSDKEVALEALRSAGAEVPYEEISRGIRENLRPGQGRAVSEHNLIVERAAQYYDDLPRRVTQEPTDTIELDAIAEPPPLPPPPLPAGPPPLPAAAPEPARVRAAPPPPPEFDDDGTRILPDSAVTPVPPSARYQPPPPAAPKRPSARAPARTVISHSNVPEPDPVGALAAQAPPTDDIGALMEEELIADAINRGEIDPAELLESGHLGSAERSVGGPPPPRPSARYQPPPAPPTTPPARPSARYQPQPEAMPAGPSEVPGAQAIAPPAEPLPPDPVGALAAQAAPPPLPAAPPERFVRGVPAAVQPTRDVVHGMSVDDFLAEKTTLGGKIDQLRFSDENARNQAEYGALMEAARRGFAQSPGVDPTVVQRWDDANRQEGVLRLIADEGQAAADNSTPRWISGLGGVGSAGAIGAHALSTLGAPTTFGLGAGIAASRWALPRTHALQANWLSRDTSALAERISGIGQKPVGSLMSGFGDLLREPPPAATSENENGPTSSLSPGEFLGRDTTNAMLANPEAFRQYADDYSQAGTDDRRAAVTERLYRSDPDFAKHIYPIIRGEQIA